MVQPKNRRIATEAYADAAVDASPTIARLMPKSVDAPSGFDANTVRGAAHYHVHTSDAGLNMPTGGPSNDSFDFEVKPIASNSDIQFAFSLLTGNWSYRTRYNEAFSPWILIGARNPLSTSEAATIYVSKADADTKYQAKANVAPTPASSGFKVVPLSLTLGQGSATAPATATYRIPQKWNAPISRFRICGTNRNVRNGVPVGSGIAVSGLWVGAHAGSGAFAGTPVKAAEAFTMPENGDVWRSGWINGVNIGDNQEMLFSYDYTSTVAPALLVAGAYTSASKVASQVAPAGLTLGKTAALDFWIEAETLAGTPVVGVLGDSLASGAQATLPCYDSVASIYARKMNGLPIHYAVSSDTLSDWISNPNEHKVIRWSHLARPDVLLLSMVHNDIYGLNIPQATLQANFAKALQIISQVISPNIVGSTITPRNSGSAAQHAERHTYNTFLRSQLDAGNIRDLFDFDQVITGGTDTIKAEYNADGIHFNTAGYQAESDSITRPIVAPPFAYRTV